MRHDWNRTIKMELRIEWEESFLQIEANFILVKIKTDIYVGHIKYLHQVVKTNKIFQSETMSGILDNIMLGFILKPFSNFYSIVVFKNKNFNKTLILYSAH